MYCIVYIVVVYNLFSLNKELLYYYYIRVVWDFQLSRLVRLHRINYASYMLHQYTSSYNKDIISLLQ